MGIEFLTPPPSGTLSGLEYALSCSMQMNLAQQI